MLQLALLLMSNDKHKDKEASKWCMRKKVDPHTSSTNQSLLRELRKYLLFAGVVYEIVTVPFTC